MSQSHTILLFAQNKRGVLERLTMMIRKKMYNLEQITASDTQTPGIKRVTVTFSHQEKAKIPHIINQMNKIMEVTQVKDVTESTSSVKVEAGLIKINRPHHIADVTPIISMFEAKIIDVTTDYLIVQVVGSTEHVLSCKAALTEFGIQEFSSTGAVAMERMN